MSLYGREGNVAVCKATCLWVLDQLQELANQATAQYARDMDAQSIPAYARAHGLTCRKSFLIGAVGRVLTRLTDAEFARYQTQPDVKAIVLDRSKEALAYRDKLHPKLVFTVYDLDHSRAGREAGGAAGNNVSLGISKHLDNMDNQQKKLEG